MSTPNQVTTKMEYIQKLFLGVQNYMRSQPEIEVEDLIKFLDAETPEFRSIAYESASFGFGLFDFSKGTELIEWEKLYNRSGKVHYFHLDIGLGWAFAKNKTIPDLNWKGFHPRMRWMVFDGIGYYHALYKGRSTVKNQIIPEGIEGKDRNGYDQGVGRRLWYIAKGEVKKLTPLMEKFSLARHPNLWRGVGIACGYVGGNNQTNTKLLLASAGEFQQQLSTGIALAAISRNASESVSDNIEMACQVFCKMSLKEVVDLDSRIATQLDCNSVRFASEWISQIEAEFAQKKKSLKP